jgi:hypothetical protein
MLIFWSLATKWKFDVQLLAITSKIKEKINCLKSVEGSVCIESCEHLQKCLDQN